MAQFGISFHETLDWGRHPTRAVQFLGRMSTQKGAADERIACCRGATPPTSLDVYGGRGYLLRTPSGTEPVHGERVSGSFFKPSVSALSLAAISILAKIGRGDQTLCS